MPRFDNKTILITGGTSGIGLATAQRLAEEGARVIVTGTNRSRLQEAERTLPGAIALRNDASGASAGSELAEAIDERGIKLDGAFLNAGFGRMQGLGDYTAEEFDSQYHVNVRGPLLQAQALAPILNDQSSVLLNTSVAREFGMPGMAVYASTKGAVRTLTRVLAREFASRGIRVNAVSPGPIGTDFFNRAGLDQATIEQIGGQILAQVPLGRFGEPSEVAAVAVFLLSSDASFVTGSEYVVDGGMSEL